MFDEKLVTVWSAPNYCYRCGNIASIMVFKDVNTREPKLFRAVPDSERVIPPRTTTPYFLWGLRPSCWPSFLPSSYPNFRVLPSSVYFLSSTLLLKCCLLPFFLILNYLNLLFVTVSIAMFFYQFSPPSHSHLGLIWKDLRNVLILTLLHVALAYLLVWGKQDVFPLFKKPIDRTDYTEMLLLLYHSAFCFSLVSFKKFQQQSCYSVGTMDCRCLELCIPVPAVNVIVLCWMIF